MMINNLFYKFFILNNLINLTFIILFFQDLLMMWFFLEINNFLFICYLCLKLSNKKLIFLYYLIQIIASLLLIFSLIFNNFFMLNINFLMINFYFAIMLKLGIPPFHIWMPMISSYLNWDIIFIFLTIQKIIPLYMLSMMNMSKNMMIFYYLILSSAFMSMYKMINSLNLKILLTYSSINQTSWMLFLIFLKNMFWFIYMIIYTLILFIISYFFSFLKFSLFFFLNNFFYSLNFNLMCLMMILNLASMPPMSFFMLKWMNIFISIFNSNMHLIFIMMIINSLILIYIYINFMNLILFFNMIKFKFFNYSMNLINKNLINFYMIFMNFMLSITLIMI
uniref:NADH-ubiquinone oxidoreductase chain 2 n=1 Tax=Acropyga sauteri TaxID=602226 RepID=A0A6G5NJ36_9HYME|nr:NADH dehydrogenase subunit 2 [Acropyga sauteri]QBG38678.1 NADH dehydrogenase subunit 2 [Acropyga sauteri]